jgi:uracil-DNA glycosylase family 4
LVLGEGALPSALVLVGEAPGAVEERLGRPFVGPAGRLLDRLLSDAGIARGSAWLTIVVKCRRTKLEAGRLRNRPPNPTEVRWWRPWLLEELRLVGAHVVVCLGAVAASAVIHEDFRLREEHGRWFPGPHDSRALATFHPAYLLRLTGRDREQAVALVQADLARAAAGPLARGIG